MLDEHKPKGMAPLCLILAHSNAAYEARLAHGFRQLGWEVYVARGGPEVRRLVRGLEAEMVILSTDQPEESGWLTCAKLTHELPWVKVILVGDPCSRNQGLAAFLGASALVPRSDELAPLAYRLLLTRVVRTAGSCRTVGVG
jgi:hypothetical protein